MIREPYQGGPALPAGCRKPVVLCLDDERAILSALHRVLRNESYELFLTDQPEAAFQRVRRGDVSLVVTDYRMPGMDGLEVLRRMRQIAADLPGVLLTGLPGETIVARNFRPGEFTILHKPWDNDQLKRIVRSLLEPSGRDRLPSEEPCKR